MAIVTVASGYALDMKAFDFFTPFTWTFTQTDSFNWSGEWIAELDDSEAVDATGVFTGPEGELQFPESGLIDSMNFRHVGTHDTQLLNISGLSLDYVAFKQWIDAGELDLLKAHIFAGNDTITGADLDDVLSGYGGDDTIAGGAGADKLYGGYGADELTGGEGKDVLFGNQDDDSLYGEAANDVLHGGLGDDLIYGGAGYDFASYLYNAGVTVSLADSAPQGTGGAGTDTLSGIEGLTGGTGADTLTGNGGGNTLYGNGGGDTLDGGAGFDWLYGHRGDDVLTGGAGRDRLYGGLGADTASYAGATAGVTVDLGYSGLQDTVGAGRDLLSGIENLTGSDGNDVLTGDGGANVIRGGAGDDVIRGGGGQDMLIGGDGADTFVFFGMEGDGDTIDSFVSGVDKLDVSGARINDYAYSGGVLTMWGANEAGSYFEFTLSLSGDSTFGYGDIVWPWS